MSIVANPGATILLTWQSKLGETNLYPRAVIKDNAGATKATVDLTHDANGAYTGTTAALNDEGVYTMQIIAYEDSGHTTQSGVDEILSETISIQYSWRPSFGSTKADIDPKVIKSAIDEALKDKLKEVMEELKKKSEFNPKSDLVKTDIKQTSLRPILDKIDKIPQKVKLPSIIKSDNSNLVRAFEKLQNEVKNNKTDFTPNESRIIKVLSLMKSNSNDGVFFERLEKMLEQLHIQAARRDTETKGLINKVMIMIQPFLKINNILERFRGKETYENLR